MEAFQAETKPSWVAQQLSKPSFGSNMSAKHSKEGRTSGTDHDSYRARSVCETFLDPTRRDPPRASLTVSQLASLQSSTSASCMVVYVCRAPPRRAGFRNSEEQLGDRPTVKLSEAR